MKSNRVFIAAAGIVSALGKDMAATEKALGENRSALKPVRGFEPANAPPHPAGEIDLGPEESDLPRTHRLARLAADQAMAGAQAPPEAVVVGVTTGGMPRTEVFIRDKIREPQRFKHHDTGSVARDLARHLGCTGPALTVSTACASGAVAIKIAADMIRSGRFHHVLAGGADGLCRMTYYGFDALQLIDPQGARPMDRGRRGMSVAEGAAMLRLCSDPETGTGIELLGAGLSCDAHHPAAPHPDGKGAYEAMAAALTDAGLAPENIDYISLHGTGTIDNDRSEARALARLFPRGIPPASSIKGATGHTLAAAGAIEAAISARSIQTGVMPANSGFCEPDPELGITPVQRPQPAALSTVLSNSFGFGGNNAALVLGAARPRETPEDPPPLPPLRILASACVTGAGFTEATLARLDKDGDCRGALPQERISENLPPRLIRRLKRLPRLALALTDRARSGTAAAPKSIFFGTAWGPISETHDFLTGLFDSGEQFAGPTDFIGSVHNAPAGQVALYLKATGANITVCGGDHSFEQALLCANFSATGDGPFLVLGADEFHPALSGCFDPSTASDQPPCDGGGALILARSREGAGPIVTPILCRDAAPPDQALDALAQALPGDPGQRYGAIFAGIPAACQEAGQQQLAGLLERTGYDGPVVDYRRFTGQFAAASAVALVVAAQCVTQGKLTTAMAGQSPAGLDGRGILVLGLGERISAVEVVAS